MRYVDTHAHLNLPAFKDDIDAVAQRCAKAGVTVINVGTNEATSKQAVELARVYEHCYAIVGLHPLQTIPGVRDEAALSGGTPPAASGEIFNPSYYRDLAAAGKVVGIGECGFDYYHTSRDSYPVQEAAFIEQIKLANELKVPLMIHTRGPKPDETSPTGRSVYEDVYQVLKHYATVPFNVHFYAGTYEEAKKFFEIGGTVSFTGVITFASMYAEVIKAVPLAFIHAETDCPYVAPVPYRGQRCEPWMVEAVYQQLARIKALAEEEVRVTVVENARRFYQLK